MALDRVQGQRPTSCEPTWRIWRANSGDGRNGRLRASGSATRIGHRSWRWCSPTGGYPGCALVTAVTSGIPIRSCGGRTSWKTPKRVRLGLVRTTRDPLTLSGSRRSPRMAAAAFVSSGARVGQRLLRDCSSPCEGALRAGVPQCAKCGSARPTGRGCSYSSTAVAPQPAVGAIWRSDGQRALRLRTSPHHDTKTTISITAGRTANGPAPPIQATIPIASAIGATMRASRSACRSASSASPSLSLCRSGPCSVGTGESVSNLSRSQTGWTAPIHAREYSCSERRFAREAAPTQQSGHCSFSSIARV